jgi:hypothetical protein
MKANRISAMPLFGLLLCAAALPAPAQPTNVDLQQAVAAYQQAPTIDAYEKVIRMAAAMDQLPAVPTEARKHFVMGATMFKDAKSQDDFRQASAEFSQAVRLAPWWPDALYNLAQSAGASGDYASAIADLKWYQMFKLSEAEIQAAQEKSWGFEAKQKMAEQEKAQAAQEAARARELAAQKAAEDQRAQQEAAAAKQAREQEEFLRKIDGARYSCTYNGSDDGIPIVNIAYLDIRGDTVRWTRERIQGPGAGHVDDLSNGLVFRIYGREIRLISKNGSVLFTGVISADGNTIQYGNQVYKRER